jgi:hypothetical protein
MLSIHDLVEIEAGDTFLFDEAAMVGKFEREKLLLRRSSESWMNLCVRNFLTYGLNLKKKLRMLFLPVLLTGSCLSF